MLTLLLLSSAPGLVGLGNGDVKISAHIDAAELKVGPTYEFVLDVELPAGLSNANAKIAPFLQIEVPDGVVLGGKVVEGDKALAANEFLQEPFERALGELPARVPFQLESPVAEGTALGLNVVAYLVDAAGEHSFLRRRLELPVLGNGTAHEVDGGTSTWGTDERLLQIGQRAAEFELPRADGSVVALSDYVGEKNIIVTTYRAFW